MELHSPSIYRQPLPVTFSSSAALDDSCGFHTDNGTHVDRWSSDPDRPLCWPYCGWVGRRKLHWCNESNTQINYICCRFSLCCIKFFWQAVGLWDWPMDAMFFFFHQSTWWMVWIICPWTHQISSIRIYRKSWWTWSSTNQIKTI